MFPTLTLAATSFTKPQLLNPQALQVALAGRSNVGKSSLVNALANRKQLAKTSSTPGKTRSINYYRIGMEYEPEDILPTPASDEGNTHPLSIAVENDGTEVTAPEAFLVDLPGYGYARCSQAERTKWAALLEYYLRSTPGLRALALLLDSRLSPQNMDVHMAEFAHGIGLPLIPVFTKSDKPRAKELEANLLAWQAILGPGVTIITSSSQKKKGLDTLWEAILHYVAP